MNFYYKLAPALIGVSIALVQTQLAVALSAPEVSKIAQQITVQIQSKKPIADYTEAIRLNPNYANVYYTRGNARAELGDN